MFEKKFVRSLLCLVVVLSLSATATMGADILFISAMNADQTNVDDALKAFMEGLGHTVTYLDDDEDEATTEAAAAAADLVFISESVGSGGIKNEITEIETPMIVGEPWAWDEMGLTEGDGGDDPAVSTDVEIVDPGHYMAAGLSGTVAVLTEILEGGNLGKGITGPEATVIATATLSDGVTYDVIFVYEKGAALPVAPADGSAQVAADIRIGFGFHAVCYPVLSENAYALLGAAVDYALGLTGPVDNLVGWWPLNEGSGDIAIDLSGLGNDGTISNLNGGLGLDGSVWVDDPERGTVISFNGTADGAFVRAGDIPQMTLTNDFTWSFWAKHNAENTADNDIIFGNRKDENAVDFVPRQFIKFTPTKFEWHMNGNGDDNLDYDDIPADVWLHHAVVKTADQLTYYRNGVEASSGTFTQPLDFPQPLFFGGDNEGSAGENWSGLMSEVRIYDGALTGLEIMAIVKGVEQIDMEIGFAGQPLVIDGEVDGIWEGASTQYIVPVGDPADTSGSWKALYDSENLYVIVDISDDILVNDTDSSWQDDSVEFYFDGGNTKDAPPLAGDNRQYTFGWTTDDVQGSNTQIEGVEHAQVDTPTGWRIEIKLPWLSLQDTEPQAGDLIGIDCFYNDDDDGGDTREDQIWTFATDGSAWNDASQWGTAVLAADKRVDVTAAGDAIQGVPNDGLMDGDNFGWPGAETPDLAIDDDTSTKFLHFKGELEPTGFQVTPLDGATIVTGLTFTTANDAAERDPVTFELSGSNEGIDGPYELIASGDIVDFAQADAWPRFTMNATPISFNNDVAYAHYQVLFPAVRDAASANSMQIAEVELLGMPAGPVAHWKLDDGEGAVAVDSSGNGNDGTLEDGPTVVDGQFGQALAFEGSRVAIPASDSLTADLFQGSFALSAWINPKRTGGTWQQIFRSIRADDTSNDTLFINNDGRLSWRGRIGGGWAGGMCETASDVVPADQWTHFAVTGDGTNFRIYVNGALSQESAFQTTDGTNATYYIGGDPTWIDESYAGLIDEVRIYNRDLSAGEIRYLAGEREVDPSLVIYYSFDEVSDIVADQSGKGHDGVVVGDVTAEPEGMYNGAANFASGSYLDLDGPGFPAEDIPTSAMTLAAWIKCANTGGDHEIFSARASDNSWLIHPEPKSSGDIRWLLRSYGGTTIFQIRAGTMTWDEWLHFAGTYDKETAKAALYINGELIEEMDVVSPADIAGDWDLGARVGYTIDDARPFTGLMDEFRMYTRALSQDEILTIMQGM